MDVKGNKRKAISVCIALALSNNVWAADKSAAITSDKSACPTNINKLTKEQKAKLPADCLKENASFFEESWAWVVGGMMAAATAAGISINHDDSAGNDNATPPDNVTPPDNDTPPAPTSRTFSNGIVWNPGNGTATVKGVTWAVTKNTDGTWTLVNGSNRLTVTEAQASADGQTLTLRGRNESGTKTWVYDSAGKTTINSNGGSGSTYTGNDSTINTKGDITADGAGSTGSKTDGNNNTLNTDGETKGTNGGTGADITGNNNTINNAGGSSASGGGTGTNVAGNDNVITTGGDSVIAEAGSTGTKVTGDGNTVNNTGSTTVTDGGTGTRIDGNNATVNNTGDTSASSVDAGIVTIGTDVNGNGNTVNQQGDINVGDFSSGLDISGDDNTVSLTSDTFNVTGQKASGVDVSGNNNDVVFKGNMTVDKNQKADNAAQYFYDASTGINVSGNDNTVTMDGKLTVVSDTEDAGHAYGKFSGSQENIQGLVVTGDGNTVNLEKGINLVGETDAIADTAAGDSIANQRNGLNSPFIRVDGKSVVNLSADSTLSGEFSAGISNIIELSNGAELNITRDASMISDNAGLTPYMLDFVNFISTTNATANNLGNIELDDISVFYLNEGSKGENKGSITVNRTSDARTGQYNVPIIVAYAENNSSFTNAADGTITGKVINQDGVINQAAVYATSVPDALNNNAVSVEGILAIYSSQGVNDGRVDMYGRGTVGMLAVGNSTVTNNGTITADGLWVDPADTTTLAANIGTRVMDYAVGMGVGTNSFYPPGYNASAINTGTITVYNAGAGMLAFGAGNTVTNQGTINLEVNDKADPNAPLVGMAVYQGGTAINDATGVININADYGKAFYSDGNANNRIINKGTIHLGTGVPAEADNSETLAMDSLVGTLTGTTTIPAAGALVETGTAATNAGTLNGSGRLFVDGAFDNQGTVENTNGVLVKGTLHNSAGATIGTTVEMDANSTSSPMPVFNNDGSVTGQLTMWKSAVTNNNGEISGKVSMNESAHLNNSGTVSNGAQLKGASRFNNSGTVSLGAATDSKNAHILELKNTAVFDNQAGGSLIIDNNRNAVHLNNDSVLKNSGTITVSASSNPGGINLWGGTSDFINAGSATVSGGKSLVVSAADAAAGKSWFWNQDSGEVDFTATAAGQAAVSLTHSNYVGVNDGVINLHGNGAVAMKAGKNSQLVNSGTINLGEKGNAKNESGMIALQLDSGATADAVMENNGTINIYASNSYAFDRMGASGRIINNGTVNLEGSGSSLVKGGAGSVEGVTGDTTDKTEVHAATDARPADPTTVAPARSTISYYTVGTSANGTAGSLSGNHMDLVDVKVDTGFTAGTDATTQTFDNVFTGSDIQGAQNIQSTSVVWSAQGSTDASGNVDVTMSKNAYADAAQDGSVGSVAGALDAGYTNNALYNSLNVTTSKELSNALKQVSGSMATRVSRDARILSNRFDMLADAAPVTKNGLAFNVVAQDDSRAEFGDGAKYDMLALRQTLEFGGNQTLAMEYGIARINGDGTDIAAGDNGLTGGYSQFFGVSHAMPLGENGLSWNNALRYDIHQFDSSRSISYGDVNETAKADTRQQYLELRSEGRRTFSIREGFDVAPYAGVRLRHTLEDGYKEGNAGDFNLNMSSSTETAVDSVVGMTLSYVGQDGWAATATLEGGPNLSYASSGKTASLQGAAGQRFDVNDGQKGGGVNSLMQVGVKYSGGNTSASLDAFHWKEDGLNDKGLMMNYKVAF